MIDFDASKIKVVFMDIGGVFLTNGWDHESREKAAKVFDFDYFVISPDYWSSTR